MSKKRLSDAESHAKWAPIARACWRGAGKRVAELAKQLGVATWALDALKVGYGEVGKTWCWTFPEMNHRGQILGIHRRLVSPINGKNKMYVKGGRRGLTYAENWQDYKGPIIIVEGASDVAAGLTLGLCAIGRPSVTGGIRQLIALIRRERRPIVVIAERDRKEHDDLPLVVKRRHWPDCKGCMTCWPGKAGARMTAGELQERLGRRVDWRLMSSMAKDMRAWLNLIEGDLEDTEAMFQVGQRLLASMGFR